MDRRKKLCLMVRVEKHWNRLPRDVVDASSLDIQIQSGRKGL